MAKAYSVEKDSHSRDYLKKQNKSRCLNNRGKEKKCKYHVNLATNAKHNSSIINTYVI